MSIRIYSELLPHLSQLNITISLSSLATSKTAVQLSAPDFLHVTHSEKSYGLILPATPCDSKQLAVPTGQSLLSYRIPVLKTILEEREDVIPWSAPQLGSSSTFDCKKCNTRIIPPIPTWRDLPSENWAEMMEFWHCHKPAHASQHGVEGKAYGAGSKITALQGCGFVDTLYFLLCAEDVSNVTVRPVAELV